MQDSETSLTTSTESGSRPTTPDSQMTNSLHRANSTIDELTATLAKVSRAPSPDSADRDLLRCCCGREDCANTAAWTSFQSKLESRLILCAEVGQALLQKHEAYVRRHGLDDRDIQSDDDGDLSRPETPTIHSARPEYDVNTHLNDLKKENTVLEKRLATALLNAEISESSKKSLLQELDEVKEALSKLTVNQAKSTGWEARLNAIAQERDDLFQELDNERQRARNSESQATTWKDRCIKLQSELSRLYEELDKQKQSRTELSEEILRDARARLEMVQQQQFGRTVLSDNPEVTQMMESLVADNEALKRDVAELQNLLAESREELRTMQEELEETRVLPGVMRRISSSGRPGHNYTHSWASSFGQQPASPVPRSGARSAQPYEPLTPNTEARPLSPAESRAASERRLPALSSPRPKYPISKLEVEDRNTHIRSPELSGRKSPRRPLFLLSHEKAVQTDTINWATLLAPVLRAQTDDGSSSTPAADGQSESSSLAETHAHGSTIAAVVDRTNTLFSRMTQADARTLMNRLKRQRLAGDISHLSHATVSSILSEANGLRAHFRGVLEDDRAVSTCTRRDLRALLNLLREMFAELGEMRVALNDIILDPSSAPKFSEVAMDPSKQFSKVGGRGAKQGPAGWMAPLSKLFGTATTSQANTKAPENTPVSDRVGSGSPATNATVRQKPTRFIPKSGPALAASATTVKVEFSGTAVGRSVTSSTAMAATAASAAEPERSSTPVPVASSRSLMGIFAGAPQPQSEDPWVFVASKPGRSVRGQKSTMDMRTATLTRTAGRWTNTRLPRNVDAVVDSGSAIQDSDEDENGESSGVPDTLLERTLRPRGLSDSSIRTTFLNDGATPASPTVDIPDAPAPTPISPVPVRAPLRGGSALRQSTVPIQGSLRTSVLQSFSRAFAIPSLSTPSDNASSSPVSTSSREPISAPNRAASPRGILPSFAGWAASQAGLDAQAADDFVGSVRDREDEAVFGRPAWQREGLGRDI
ncbi:hypothetical protein ACEPAF_6231 [Sanghuangporus sanghuang]